ncbi:spermidine synthase, partial [Streptomyces sp. NPDC057062]
MIDRQAPVPPGSTQTWDGPDGPRTGDPGDPAGPGGPGSAGSAVPLPVRQRTGRWLVLAGVFVCAACGLVYELELVALAAYLS